jgi:hypothetical protein
MSGSITEGRTEHSVGLERGAEPSLRDRVVIGRSTYRRSRLISFALQLAHHRREVPDDLKRFEVIGWWQATPRVHRS